MASITTSPPCNPHLLLHPIPATMWTTLLTSAAVKIFLLIANKTMTKVEKNSGVIILNQKTLRGHGTEMEDLQNRVRQLESGQLRRRVSRSIVVMSGPNLLPPQIEGE